MIACAYNSDYIYLLSSFHLTTIDILFLFFTLSTNNIIVTTHKFVYLIYSGMTYILFINNVQKFVFLIFTFL